MKFELKDLQMELENMGFEENELQQNMSLADDLGVDSTEMIDLCSTLFKKHQVRIPSTEFKKLGSKPISEFIDYVNSMI